MVIGYNVGKYKGQEYVCKETPSKRKHGPDVIYLHLAHNAWDPEKKTTRTKILHSFGRKDELDVDKIRGLVKSLSSYLPPEERLHLLPKDFKLVWSKEFGHLYLLRHLWKKFGLDVFFKEELSKRSFETPLEKAIFCMVAQRAIAPSSKLFLCETWMRNEVYFPEVDELSVHHLYRAMDFLFEHLEDLEVTMYNQLVDLFSMDVSVIFYDTTSLYFEIEKEDEDEEEKQGLRKFGHSKDHRNDRPQIIVGLATGRNGYPIRHWVFPGNQTDVTTLKKVIENLGALRPRTFIFVSDRGALSKDNIDYLESRRLKYILGVKVRSNPLADDVMSKRGRFMKVANNLYLKEKKVRDGARELRYILAYNPKEAKRDREKREEVLTFINEKLSHLRGHNKSCCELLSHRTYKRYLKLSKSGKPKIDTAKIKQEERLDGKWILSTNEFTLPPEDIVKGYKNLARMEEAFKQMKHVLDIRPVYHTKDERIRAHVGLCVLAYLLTTHAENLCNMSWKKIRSTLGTLHAGCIKTPQETFIKITECTKEQKRIFKNFSIKQPPEVLKILPKS